MLDSIDKKTVIDNVTTQLNTMIVKLVNNEFANYDYLPKGKTITNDFGTNEINVNTLEEYNLATLEILNDKHLTLTEKVTRHNELLNECIFNNQELQIEQINIIYTILQNLTNNVGKIVSKQSNLVSENMLQTSTYTMQSNYFYSQNMQTLHGEILNVCIIKSTNKYHCIIDFSNDKYILNCTNLIDLIKTLAKKYNVITKLTVAKTFNNLSPLDENNNNTLNSILLELLKK